MMPLPPIPPLTISLVMFSFLCFCACHQSEMHQNCTGQQTCGIVPINYPFGKSKGCGHPDFQIECIGNSAVITIKKQRFRILGVSFGDPQIHVASKIAVVDESVFASPCALPGIYNPANFTGSRFHKVSNTYATNLGLCCNCKEPIPSLSLVACNSSCYWSLGSSSSLIIFAALLLFKCRDCESSEGHCGYNASDSKTHFLCYCQDGPHSHNCTDGRRWARTQELCADFNRQLLLLCRTCLRKCMLLAFVAIKFNFDTFYSSYLSGNAGSCIGGTMVIVAAIIVVARMKRRNQTSDNRNHFRFQPMEVIVNDQYGKSTSNSPAIFSYKQLEEATNSFDHKRKLGDGGFGSVYLGKLQNGLTVAVKKLHEDNSKRLEQFANEVRVLSSVCHSNLVRLYGWCQNSRNLLLVYEYVPNVTLADHLHGQLKGKGLLWGARLNIALETARALAFLHFEMNPPIFHRDVKPTNILLDGNLRVKVADFGLSRLMPIKATHVSTVPQGTPGYLDPDYHQSYQLTDKSDVYSFGVVLIEIISAKMVVDTTREGKEIGLANLAISKIQSGTLHELVGFESTPLVKATVTRVAELAFRCLAAEKDDRPCMMEVACELEEINQMGYGRRQSVESCFNSFECSHGSDKTVAGMQAASPNSVQTKWSSSSPSTSDTSLT
eukprot:Gb_01112 [translate_table: standard]